MHVKLEHQQIEAKPEITMIGTVLEKMDEAMHLVKYGIRNR